MFPLHSGTEIEDRIRAIVTRILKRVIPESKTSYYAKDIFVLAYLSPETKIEGPL